MTECQQLIYKAENTDAPQPENLLSELLDVVERVNRLSSALIVDTNEALTNIKSQENKDPVFSSMEFSPIYHDPGCRREIMSDEDRIYMIKQGPF